MTIKIEEKVPSIVPSGKVRIFKIPAGEWDRANNTSYFDNPVIDKPINNTITNEVAEFFVGWLNKEPEYNFTHIYGQWGNASLFPEGGGPYIVPQRDDTVADLTPANIFITDAEVPIINRMKGTQAGQSEFTNNIISVMGVLTKNDTKVYVGAGLVCEVSSTKKLLLSHVAFDGILKESTHDLLIIWDWIFTNT